MSSPALLPRLHAAKSLLLSVESILDRTWHDAKRSNIDTRWLDAINVAIIQARNSRVQVANIAQVLAQQHLTIPAPATDPADTKLL